ncbi:MAG: nucleotide sugar dehydrogenase [bacterium]|nr:nucleotide sugar dehydrogenase [bacterium]
MKKKSHSQAKRTPKKVSKETVAVVGLGYVGLPLALLCARKGYRVIGIDHDAHKIELLHKKTSPFIDEGITRELKKTTMKFDTESARVAEATIIVICVPTPVYEDYMPNLEPLTSAGRSIAPHMKRGTLVIIESTVNPGVSEDIIMPILEEGSGFACGVEFEISHCPERINPGDTVWNVESIPRVVGSSTERGLAQTVRFYESILSARVKPMGSLKEAEAVKVVENSFRDVNIAFVNELAMSFRKMGIDVMNVINGAATKPFSFMPHFPGCGVGGHCIPVDPYYLINCGKENGFNHQFLSMARRINNHMPMFTVEITEEALRAKGFVIRGSKVAVLGMSYKPGVDDVRESPSHKIIEALKAKGAHPVSYDPYAIRSSDVKNLNEALSGATAVIVATAHKEFVQELSPRRLEEHGVSVIVDGRNCLSKEKFLMSNVLYAGIGR